MTNADWLFLIFMIFALNEIYAFLRIEKFLNYFSVSDVMTKQVHPLGFLLYRFLPVFVIAVAIATYFKGTNIQVLTTYALALSHVGAKDVVGIYKSLRHQYTLRILVHLLIIIFVLLVVTPLSIYIANHTDLSRLKPSYQGVVDNVWAAFLILILASFYYRMTRVTNYISKNIKKSLESIDNGLLEYAYDKSIQRNTDPFLALAVMIYENLQRPLWIRKFEKRMSRIFNLPASSGIMQVKRKGPVSDRKSIDIALDQFFKDLPYPADYLKMEQLLKNYNSDPKYYLDVSSIYGIISQAIVYGEPLDKSRVMEYLDSLRKGS